jgi:DNA-binding CsgD family transcriptional regulator
LKEKLSRKTDFYSVYNTIVSSWEVASVDGAGRAHPSTPLERLNPRQRDVLFLISKGLHDSEIGNQLGLSERGIRYYVAQLFLIFEVTNRTELIGRVAEDGPGLVALVRTGPERSGRPSPR